MADLSDILVEARRRRGWTQEQLAAHWGVSLSTVTRAEQRKGTPHRNSLRHLASVIGLDPESLALRWTRVPHFGGVSAVRTDERQEIGGQFTHIPDVGVDFTFSVDGQCMEPRYQDGERLGCSVARWNREGFVWGKDYWIRFTDGQMTLKRVERDPRYRDKLVCVPLNPKMRPFSCPKMDVEKAARVLVVLTT